MSRSIDHKKIISENKRLKTTLVELKTENRKLRLDTFRDDLTGLYNARCLKDKLQDFLHEMETKGVQPALLFIDVDFFKEVNERHGHEAAGKILRHVGRLIANCIRIDDIGFRYGGDEFVVLLAGERGTAQRVAERIRACIAKSKFVIRGLSGSASVRLTVSIGIRMFQKGDTSLRLLEEADRAMFEAKRKSRNLSLVAS